MKKNHYFCYNNTLTENAKASLLAEVSEGFPKTNLGVLLTLQVFGDFTMSTQSHCGGAGN